MVQFKEEMEEPRQGDCRVPLISSVFFVCLATGGALLVMYVFTPSVSEPWFPIAAFVMIGIPWAFWVITYIYSCTKVCFRRASLDERQISRRNFGGPSRKNATSSQDAMVARNASMSGNSPNKDGKHVQFAAVVVIDERGENGHSQECHKERGGDSSSVTSSTESEMPLNVGGSSSL